ncbi:tumor suppressor protein Gltscr2 [Russula earlei]|uniref:Tumor suppressor protein Gltscr2 n=1 Tax=Russula earlei TaxID=71964 RepID=A0ACC0UPE9_9AGAM|nr:tumor suppressor protein Gltscr2 [Russula earlei]
MKPKKKPSAVSIVGAPAQHNQSSRKGKKAWRKNVDIEDLEEKLEGLREEERTFGLALQKTTDDGLFIVDTKGDDKGMKLSTPTTKYLMSHQIISQRSAVPAVHGRPRKSPVRPRDKERLLRIARKDRRGPLNSIVDPSQPGAGSALLEVSEAVKKSGKYDMWSAEANPMLDDEVKVKAPDVPHPRKAIALPAVPAPHAGTSYNPPEAAHTALLRTAHESELRRVREAETLEATKARILAARRADDDSGRRRGARHSRNGPEPHDPADLDGARAAKSTAPKRKTKRQRRKAERLRAERHALLERTLRKRLHASVDTVKTARKVADKALAARVQAASERRAKQEARLAQGGLVGQKLGKHLVREGEVDVQLGEELSESLRGLQPEGNLFRDRFLSMQQRALIEPRVPVLPRKRKQTVEYEKHAWKRFV